MSDHDVKKTDIMKIEEAMEKFGVAAPFKRRRVYAEDALQIACKAWFDAQYPDLRLLLHHSPNEGRLLRKDRDGAKRKAMGVRAGFPDFILLVGGRYLCIELKSAKGRQTEHQKEYQQAVEGSGGRYVVVRSLDEFKAAVKGWLLYGGDVKVKSEE